MLSSCLLPAYSTASGSCYQAEALEFMKSLPDNHVSLVMTSPPFALRRKKAYGNVADDAYVEWFMPFADEIFRILRPTAALSSILAAPGIVAAERGRSINTS